MNFRDKVEEIIGAGGRYSYDAYEFIMQGLMYAQTASGRTGHVTGKEVLEAIRRMAIEQYGPMARTVLQHWGIKTTADVGEIVFSMVAHGLMSKTDQDTPDDFRDVYNFETAFNAFENMGKI